MRRPRAGLVSRPSGDAGLCPGALQTPRQELADAEPPRFAQDMDAAAARKGSRSVPKARRSGETQSADPASQGRTPPMERREAPALSKRQRGLRKTGAPRGAPFPSNWRGGETCPRERGMEGGLPGASNNTGGGALAKGCLTIEDGERRAGEQHFPLIPAQAGIQGSKTRGSQQRLWVPACAGTSGGEGRATRINTPLFAAIAACYHRPSA